MLEFGSQKNSFEQFECLLKFQSSVPSHFVTASASYDVLKEVHTSIIGKNERLSIIHCGRSIWWPVTVSFSLSLSLSPAHPFSSALSSASFDPPLKKRSKAIKKIEARGGQEMGGGRQRGVFFVCTSLREWRIKRGWPRRGGGPITSTKPLIIIFSVPARSISHTHTHKHTLGIPTRRRMSSRLWGSRAIRATRRPRAGGRFISISLLRCAPNGGGGGGGGRTRVYRTHSWGETRRGKREREREREKKTMGPHGAPRDRADVFGAEFTARRDIWDAPLTQQRRPLLFFFLRANRAAINRIAHWFHRLLMKAFRRPSCPLPQMVIKTAVFLSFFSTDPQTGLDPSSASSIITFNAGRHVPKCSAIAFPCVAFSSHIRVHLKNEFHCASSDFILKWNPSNLFGSFTFPHQSSFYSDYSSFIDKFSIRFKFF